MKRAEHTPTSRAASLDSIEELASQWLARRYGGFSSEDSAAFEAWLAADPRHGSAITELERAWQIVSSPGKSGQGAIAQERQRVRVERQTRSRRRQAARALAGLAAAALVVFAFTTWQRSDSARDADVRIVVRPDVQRLPDGSTVQLNAGAQIVTSFSAGRRAVSLVRGEALFTVAPDAQRPFVVSAGGVDVTAVGTAFAVRFGPEKVAVLVTHGTVAVERNATAPSAGPAPVAAEAAPVIAPVRVTAGQRAEVSAERVPAVTRATPSEMDAALAWRDRRIEFTRTPLTDAFDLFNRQNPLQLVVADARTGEFEISGIFWADDPESLVRLLDSAFNMSAERTGQKVIVRKR